MVVRRRKKCVKFRGFQTHGWGAKKKHRGKGNKGGAGMAGTGKRADSKKPSIWNNPDYFGMHKFICHSARKNVNSINIIDIDRRFSELLQRKFITKENDVFVLDLSDLGYNKLLSKGSLTHRMRITVEKASKGAAEKVKQAKGELVVENVDKAEKPQTKIKS